MSRVAYIYNKQFEPTITMFKDDDGQYRLTIVKKKLFGGEIGNIHYTYDLDQALSLVTSNFEASGFLVLVEYNNPALYNPFRKPSDGHGNTLVDSSLVSKDELVQLLKNYM